MVTININANEKKAYVTVNGGDEIICPLVKETNGKYSVNIKKLGFGKSFLSIGDLEDKELEIDEATLVAGRTAGKKKGPKSLGYDGAEYLSEEEAEEYRVLIDKINEAYAKEYEEAKSKAAAPKKKLTDLEKLEAQIAKLLAKKEALVAEANGDTDTAADDEDVEIDE